MSEQIAPARALLAGRYRLESVVATGPCTTLWRARDEVLARAVAIKVLHAPGSVPRCADTAAAVTTFTTSATSVGKLAHPRIASTYDAGVDGDTAYIVTEWVDGEAVADVVRRTGPLSAAQAHTVATQTAAALAYAHDNGIPHGQVDGFNVLLCGDGGVKLTDFGVASALAPDRPADAPPERRSPAGQDVRAAAALLYLCLTGRSVGGTEPGLPPAPRTDDGVLLSPQQVRAGVSRDLDAVVMRTLGDARRSGPPIVDSAELLAALEAVRPPAPVDGPDADRPVTAIEPTEPSGSRLFRIGAPAVLAGVVLAAILVAVALGPRPAAKRSATTPPASKRPSAAGTSTPPVSAPASGAAAGPAAKLDVKAARDFDPQANPPSENPADVALAYDGDPATSWDTDRYRTAVFGNLKAGVGVVFDLGQPAVVDQVALTFAAAGASLELRAGDTPGTSPDDFAVVASAADAGTSATVRPTATGPHRYWLLWLTKLPAVRGGFRAQVAEVTFTGRVAR
ncbi:MAG: hypothetical protein QOG49_822 [Frankiaceae bacterium]|nr:hypothetical protein [Frankiaceae bacterium]